jgi:hypothetical protein
MDPSADTFEQEPIGRPPAGHPGGVTAGLGSRRFESRVKLPVDWYAVILGILVLAQAVWFGYLAGRGWFYGDDLSYMAAATGQPLRWSYLSGSVNDHFVPGLRLVFWLLNRFTGLDYGVTILVRMLLQAAATLLLYRLLVLLVGRRPGTLLVLGWYAFGLLLLPGSVWLTTSVDLMTSQVLVILAIDLHLRYTITGRLRSAVGCALCLLGAVSFWELSALTVLVLPILSLGFVHTGTPRQRLRAGLGRWPGWLILAVALLVWLVLFLTGPYGGSAHSLSPAAAWRVVRVGWLDALVPALFGGPWHWFYTAEVYFPLADPPLVLVVLAQLGLAVVLVMGWHRTGRRALLAWSLPVLTFVLGTLVVAFGRFQVFGELTARSYNYAFPLAVPTALAVALSLLPSNPFDVAARTAGGRTLATGEATATEGIPAVPAGAGRRWTRLLGTGTGRWRTRLLGAGRWRTWLLGTGAALLLVSTLVSYLSFGHRWSQNPAERYVSTLRASVRAAGPNVNVWDTRVPTSVLAFVSDANHVSDVLALAGVPARFDDPATEPLLALPDGRLAPAGLYPVARGVQRPRTPCTALVRGTGTWTIPLTEQPGTNEYFVQISYFQQKSSSLYLSIRERSGKVIAPVAGDRTLFGNPLANLYVRLPLAAPHELVVRSESLDANVCIGAVIVGFPVALAAK